MDREELWAHIHAERRALAQVLAGLSDEQWHHETLCPGWDVRDVAAHVIAHPQIRVHEMAGMLARNLGRGYNTMTLREVQRRGARETPESILRDFETYDGSTRTVPGTTMREALIDVLLHTQDILRPLGLSHDMPPEAAAVAADRARSLAWLTGWTPAKRLRLVATDVDWTRGSGPEVRGPMQELLMIAGGRVPDPALVSGDGVALVARGG